MHFKEPKSTYSMAEEGFSFCSYSPTRTTAKVEESVTYGFNISKTRGINKVGKQKVH